MANEDLFRRSYERMTLSELTQTSDSLGTEIRREGRELQNYGKRNVVWRHDTTGWYTTAAASAQPTARSPWSANLASKTRTRAFHSAKELSRNQIRSIDNAVANMDGKLLRQHRHDIEWHRKYILALGCMVLFLVGSSLGALVGKGGLGLPTLLALCVFLLYYVVSMVGEQLVKSGTLEPWSGMWLSTLLLTPLAALLMWSTLKERRWLPHEGG